MQKRTFEIGKVFGRLTVIELLPGTGMVKCKCECGTVKKVRKSSLRGTTRSCGCLNKELVSKRFRTMKADHPKLYGVYRTMINRCYRTNATSFEIYGGRGIRVDDVWLKSFENFCTWALHNGYKKGLTLDRINVNKNYGPDNCRFVDRKTQGRNRRCTKLLTLNGETLPLTEWAEKAGIKASLIHNRLRKGWPEDKLLMKPLPYGRKLDNGTIQS